MTPQERYEQLVDELTGLDGVRPPEGGSGFGRGALRYRRKIFAMFVRGQLVVKLPQPRVDELVAGGGHGERVRRQQGHADERAVQPGPQLRAALAATGPRGAGLRPVQR